jgi:hypothetical protein
MTDWKMKPPIRPYRGSSFHERKFIRVRLAERAVCEAEHAAHMVPDSGLGWTGTRCSLCGFRFFGEWEDWASGMTKDRKSKA